MIRGQGELLEFLPSKAPKMSLLFTLVPNHIIRVYTFQWLRYSWGDLGRVGGSNQCLLTTMEANLATYGPVPIVAAVSDTSHKRLKNKTKQLEH